MFKSVADVRRIPIGTILVSHMFGPSRRKVVRFTSADMIVKIIDPSHKHFGEESRCSITRVKVEDSGNGFKVLNKDGELLAHYTVEKEASKDG